MAKYLVTFNDQLGEIELKGFVVMTDKEYEKFEELAASITWDFIYQISEEEIEFSSGEDLLTRIDYKEISNEEAKVIKKLFNNEFGVFVTEEYLESIVGDEGLDEEEEDLEEDDDFNDRRKGSKYDDEFDDDY